MAATLMFTCPKCFKTMDNMRAMMAHITKHHLKKRPFRCHICADEFLVETKFPNDSDLIDHLKNVHNSECNKLSYVHFETFLENLNVFAQQSIQMGCVIIKQEDGTEKTIQLFNGEPSFICPCDIQYHGVFATMNHLKEAHAQWFPFSCHLCPSQVYFSCCGTLVNHLEEKHQKKGEKLNYTYDAEKIEKLFNFFHGCIWRGWMEQPHAKEFIQQETGDEEEPGTDECIIADSEAEIERISCSVASTSAVSQIAEETKTVVPIATNEPLQVSPGSDQENFQPPEPRPSTSTEGDEIQIINEIPIQKSVKKLQMLTDLLSPSRYLHIVSRQVLCQLCSGRITRKDLDNHVLYHLHEKGISAYSCREANCNYRSPKDEEVRRHEQVAHGKKALSAAFNDHRYEYSESIRYMAHMCFPHNRKNLQIPTDQEIQAVLSENIRLAEPQMLFVS